MYIVAISDSVKVKLICRHVNIQIDINYISIGQYAIRQECESV